MTPARAPSPAALPPSARRIDRHRAVAALAVTAGVLLLHGALLRGLPAPPGLAAKASDAIALRTLQVRQLQVPRALITPEPEIPAAAPPQTPRRVARAPLEAALSSAAADPQAAAPAPAGAREPADFSASEADGAPVVLPAGTPLPTYATRLPPPFTLQYAVKRDAAERAGVQAQLRWRLLDGGYTLAMGLGAVGWASVGGLDLHGLAPERHVETRRGREVRAANFQREPAADGRGGGRITFSGPPIEHPLLPGVQDRLSWMVQLPAALDADPALGAVGSTVTLLVVGVRGEAAWWLFKVVAREALELPAGTVAEAVYLQREPQRPYDTRVEVWLDPARHHLPVRLRLQNRGDGPVTEFRLTEFSRP